MFLWIRNSEHRFTSANSSENWSMLRGFFLTLTAGCWVRFWCGNLSSWSNPLLFTMALAVQFVADPWPWQEDWQKEVAAEATLVVALTAVTGWRWRWSPWSLRSDLVPMPVMGFCAPVCCRPMQHPKDGSIPRCEGQVPLGGWTKLGLVRHLVRPKSAGSKMIFWILRSMWIYSFVFGSNVTNLRLIFIFHHYFMHRKRIELFPLPMSGHHLELAPSDTWWHHTFCTASHQRGSQCQVSGCMTLKQ